MYVWNGPFGAKCPKASPVRVHAWPHVRSIWDKVRNHTSQKVHWLCSWCCPCFAHLSHCFWEIDPRSTGKNGLNIAKGDFFAIAFDLSPAWCFRVCTALRWRTETGKNMFWESIHIRSGHPHRMCIPNLIMPSPNQELWQGGCFWRC